MRLVCRTLPIGSKVEKRARNSLCAHEFDGVWLIFVVMLRETSKKLPVATPAGVFGSRGMKIIGLFRKSGTSCTRNAWPGWLMLNGKAGPSAAGISQGLRG